MIKMQEKHRCSVLLGKSFIHKLSLDGLAQVILPLAKAKLQ